MYRMLAYTASPPLRCLYSLSAAVVGGVICRRFKNRFLHYENRSARGEITGYDDLFLNTVCKFMLNLLLYSYTILKGKSLS